MTIAVPFSARSRLEYPQWRRLYDGPFAERAAALSRSTADLLAAQHRDDGDGVNATAAQWRATLEELLPGESELTRLVGASRLAARDCAAMALRSARALSAGVPNGHVPWTQTSAESVLMDIGAGVTAHRLGISARKGRRPAEAADWWQCAAVTHHPQAKNELALLAWARGDLVDVGRWGQKAAENGNPPFGIPPEFFPPE